MACTIEEPDEDGRDPTAWSNVDARGLLEQASPVERDLVAAGLARLADNALAAYVLSASAACDPSRVEAARRVRDSERSACIALRAALKDMAWLEGATFSKRGATRTRRGFCVLFFSRTRKPRPYEFRRHPQGLRWRGRRRAPRRLRANLGATPVDASTPSPRDRPGGRGLASTTRYCSHFRACPGVERTGRDMRTWPCLRKAWSASSVDANSAAAWPPRFRSVTPYGRQRERPGTLGARHRQYHTINSRSTACSPRPAWPWAGRSFWGFGLSSLRGSFLNLGSFFSSTAFNAVAASANSSTPMPLNLPVSLSSIHLIRNISPASAKCALIASSSIAQAKFVQKTLLTSSPFDGVGGASFGVSSAAAAAALASFFAF